MKDKKLGIYLPAKDASKPRDYITNPGIIDKPVVRKFLKKVRKKFDGWEIIDGLDFKKFTILNNKIVYDSKPLDIDLYGKRTPVRFAGRLYKGQDGTLVAGEDFVPISAVNPNFPERAQIEMMQLFDDLFYEKHRFHLYEWHTLDNGDAVFGHTERGRESLEQANQL